MKICATSAKGRHPSRRHSSFAPSTFTTVLGMACSAEGPLSSTRSACTAAAASSAVLASGSPLALSLVSASEVPASPARRRFQHQGQRPGPVVGGEGLQSGIPVGGDRPHLFHARGQPGDRLVAIAALGGQQLVEGPRNRRGAGDAVDRFGGDNDEPAGGQNIPGLCEHCRIGLIGINFEPGSHSRDCNVRRLQINRKTGFPECGKAARFVCHTIWGWVRFLLVS